MASGGARAGSSAGYDHGTGTAVAEARIEES